MKKIVGLSWEELQEQIATGRYVLFFTADWCPDCNFISPVMPEIEADFADFVFLRVDRDENMNLANSLGILGIPSFIAFDNGEEIGRFVNKKRKTKQEVENFLGSL